MNLAGLIESPLATAFGLALFHFLWQGALVHGALVLTLRLVPAASSQLRYALACGALLAMVALPLGTTWWLLSRPLDLTLVSQAAAHVGAASTEELAAIVAAARSGFVYRAGELLAPVAYWLLAVWVVGGALFGVRLLGGLVIVRRLGTTGLRRAPGDLRLLASKLAYVLGVEPLPPVRESTLALVPMVVGLLRPMILLPTSVVTGLTPRQLELLLAHELAHVGRFDLIVNLLQGVGETLLFFHPSVWAVSRVVRCEREHCCDAVALSVATDPVLYAKTLHEVARLSSGPGFAMAASGGSLLDRIARILRGPPRGPAPHPAVALLPVAMAAILLGAAAATPQAADPFARLTLQPERVAELTSGDFATLLSLSVGLPEGERVAFLSAVKAWVPARGLVAEGFAAAVRSLPAGLRGGFGTRQTDGFGLTSGYLIRSAPVDFLVNLTSQAN